MPIVHLFPFKFAVHSSEGAEYSILASRGGFLNFTSTFRQSADLPERMKSSFMPFVTWVLKPGFFIASVRSETTGSGYPACRMTLGASAIAASRLEYAGSALKCSHVAVAEATFAASAIASSSGTAMILFIVIPFYDVARATGYRELSTKLLSKELLPLIHCGESSDVQLIGY